MSVLLLCAFSAVAMEFLAADPGDFAPARFRRIAAGMASAASRQELRVIRVVPKGAAAEPGYVSSPHLGYDAWRAIYDTIRPAKAPVGEVIIWNGSASARLRLPAKPTIQLRIVGDDPYRLKVGPVEAEIISIQNSETGGVTSVFVVSRSLDAEWIRVIRAEISGRLRKEKAVIYCRKDSWFMAGGVSIHFPFHVGMPPTREQYLRSSTILCPPDSTADCRKLMPM